jgi:hypothetical protein
MNRREQLEAVLGAAIAAAPRARQITFTVEQLAEAGGRVLNHRQSRLWWGDTLQRYRGLKHRPYTIACEGYGVNAVWTLYVVPDRPALHRLAATRAHAIAVATDAVHRLKSDLDCEVLPALEANGEPRDALRFRIAEFEVNSVNMLTAAGEDRQAAMAEVLPLAAELRERWAA